LFRKHGIRLYFFLVRQLPKNQLGQILPCSSSFSNKRFV